MTELVLDVAPDVALPVDLVTESNGILGKKGSGKTSAGVVLYEEMYRAGVPVIALDPKGDWYGIRASASPDGGLPVPVFGGQHGDIALEPTAGALIADLIVRENLSCVLDVSEFSKAELQRFTTAFADRLYRAAERTPMHLILEECHEYIPQFVTGADAKMVGAWEKLVKLGRFKGIGVSLLSQRAASVNKNVLTQVDNLFIMRTTSAQDRAAIKGWIEYQANSADILSTLAGLATGECWLYQPARDEPFRFRFRMRHTYDAGQTPKVGEVRVAPTNVASVDLTAIAKAMAGTVGETKTDDAAELRQQIGQLKRQLAATTSPTPAPPEIVHVPILTGDAVESVRQQIDAARDIIQLLDETREHFAKAAQTLADLVMPARPVTAAAPAATPPSRLPAPAPGTRSVHQTGEGLHLRSGAHRMVEALGRMAPLRLTKSQWGTVAKLKTSGGTWSTYIGDIRRAGLLDENSVGYTLTDAGFDYLGGRPEPMNPVELQDHYRSILRSGATKMLDALIEAYPAGLTKDELGLASDISTSGGTFSTYVGDLTRNGLAERRAGEIFATEILMRGAEVQR